jgi:EAL domain-containing protein (putative c-di-GMP-specific phosphodiesterase class I)
VLLVEYGHEPDLLKLEIREDSPLGDTDRQMPVISRLDAIGARVAVDDFGWAIPRCRACAGSRWTR